MNQGRIPGSSHSDNSELELDGSEFEIARLQRQIRIMEGDRQAYNLHSREQIRKQQQEIEKLLGDQKDMVRSLNACRRLKCQQSENEDTQNLQGLLEHRDVLQEQLQKEKQTHRELQKEISNMQSTIFQLKKGEAAYSDMQKSEGRRIQKVIRTLEYKLDRATTRLSDQLTKNSQVREDLKTLHLGRLRFQHLRNGLNQELQDIRLKIGNITELSTIAYDMRVEAQSKMALMKERAVKDLAQYNTEMKELERMIAHEYNLNRFMTVKCSERGRLDDDEIESRRLAELRHQKRMDSGEVSLDTLEQLFDRIHDVTGEGKIDQLVSHYFQVEDRNFALFNFVNEQNNKTEEAKYQISQIEEEIEQLRVRGLQQERDNCTVLEDINKQHKKLETQTKDYESQVQVKSNVLDQVKTGVSSIFSNIECDRSVINDLLGSSAGVTENNIMFYLGLVEQRTNELLSIDAFLNSKDLERDYNPKNLAKFLLGQNVLQQSNKIQLAGTSVDYNAEGASITDVAEHPLTRGELRRKIVMEAQTRKDSVQQKMRSPKSFQLPGDEPRRISH